MKKIFDGTISCKSVLESDRRQIFDLYVDPKKRSKDISYIIHLAKSKDIPIFFVERSQLDELCHHTRHGGIALKAGLRDNPSIPLLDGKYYAYVDGVEDPYNLGSVCRNLYASGCEALILPKRDWSNSEEIILKASAGAYERMDIFFIENEQDLVISLKKAQIPLICAYRKDAENIYNYMFPERFCIAVGGALRGLNKTILQASHQNLFIPYGRPFRNALDTPSACAVIGFEILRQKS